MYFISKKSETLSDNSVVWNVYLTYSCEVSGEPDQTMVIAAIDEKAADTFIATTIKCMEENSVEIIKEI